MMIISQDLFLWFIAFPNDQFSRPCFLVHCVPKDHFSRPFFLVHCVPNDDHFSRPFFLGFIAFPIIVPYAFGLAPIRQFFSHWLKNFSLDFHILSTRQKTKKQVQPGPTTLISKLGEGGGEGGKGCLICSHSPSGRVLDLFSRSPSGLVLFGGFFTCQNLGPSILYLFCSFFFLWVLCFY
jgi:hypothetical protein